MSRTMPGFIRIILPGIALGFATVPAAALAAARDPLPTHVSVGQGQGAVLPCWCNFYGIVNQNEDGTIEDAYCWQYGGIVAPYVGAFAECYNSLDLVGGIELLLTSSGSPNGPCDLYVWDDAGGKPGNVLTMTTGVNPGGVATWPQVSTHDFPVSLIEVRGNFWVGFWADWSKQPGGYYIAVDLNGFGGCPYTNIAPGIGYPTGWNNVSTVWGPTQALGIGALMEPRGSGVCCLPDGRCIDWYPFTCERAGGIWYWDSMCDWIHCAPAGACCDPNYESNGRCTVTTQAGCAAPGIWRAGQPCTPEVCGATPVREESWGRIKALYR